jgi:hypothetical protein
MKMNILILVLAINLISVSFYSFKMNQRDPVIVSKKVTQPGIIVKDINKARIAWAQMPEVEAPDVSVDESHFSMITFNLYWEPKNKK